MIHAYAGHWPEHAKIEKHALRTARVLLPESDDCIYIGFPWSALSQITNSQTALRELTPKNRPGQRVVSVCSFLNEDVVRALTNVGVTDVFVSEVKNEIYEVKGICIHPLESSGRLEYSELVSFFVEYTEHPPGLSFNQRIESDLALAKGHYKEQLQYIKTLCLPPKAKSEKPERSRRKRVFLFGDHSHRTPLSYPDAQYPLTEYVEFVGEPQKADILLTGNRVDFIRNAEAIRDWYRAGSDRELCVVSEEPYWDTMWDKEFTQPETRRDFAGQKLPFKRLNHVTSELFKWQHLPYYITTENKFFARYAALFTRNAALTADDWLAHWAQCQYPTAFIAERRDEEKFNLSFPELDMHSDCVLRSRLAEASLNRGGFVEGKGWSEASVIRQELDDWHLDKLTKLDMKARVVSALENTHHVDYITEKLFDTYAVGGVPIYSANPETHSVWRLVGRDSLINLYGLDFEHCRDKVFGFSPDKAFAEKYASTQVELAELFSKPWLLWQERKRLAGCLGRLLNSE